MQSHERLDAWGVCHELAVAVYRAAASWPSAELYGLASEARRAVFLAAFYAADDPPAHGLEERRRRIGRVLAALDRLRYALLLAHELGYLSRDRWVLLGRLTGRADELVRARLVSEAGLPQLL